jgi:hypothetical protein
MNRLEMAEHIRKRIPTLALLYKGEWKRAKELQTEFVHDYPLKRIPSLLLDEYAIGKGPSNRSFCYRLEREMDMLGRILGSPADRFGVYYGKAKSSRNSSKDYQFAKRWGTNYVEAFTAVKQAIVDLLNAATIGDSQAIYHVTLSGTRPERSAD